MIVHVYEIRQDRMLAAVEKRINREAVVVTVLLKPKANSGWKLPSENSQTRQSRGALGSQDSSGEA